MPEHAAPEATRLPTAAEWPAIAALWKRTSRELVARFGGSSMDPTIPAGAEVLLRCGERAESGDVIAFLAHDQIVVHRVEAAGKSWVLTRGDRQVIPDDPIFDRSVILGRILGLRQGEGWTDLLPPPSSRTRAALRGLCVAALRASPPVGAALVRGLLALRRGMSALPRAVRRRLGRPRHPPPSSGESEAGPSSE